MRDPFNKPPGKPQTEGGILSICAEITPDIVYLFPSASVLPSGIRPQNSTENNASQVETEYKNVSPECEFRIRPLEVEDVTDFAELSVEFEKKIAQVISDFGGAEQLVNYDFHLNCSSGTQQMTAIGYIMANTGRIPQIHRWQAKDPDFAAGRARVREIVVDVFEENNCIEKIKSNLAKLNYYSIKDDCLSLSAVACSMERRNHARTLAVLFDAYLNLDLLNYQEANRLLKSILRSTDPMPEDARVIIREQKDFLSRILQTGEGLEREDETYRNLTDLYFNMERCFKRGAYADVLARFRRILEGAAYYILRTSFETNPRDVQHSNNAANLQLLKGYHSFGDVMGHVPFHKAYKALEIFDAEFGLDVYKDIILRHEENVKRLTKKRNGTYIAHGMLQADREDAEESIPLAREMLIELLPDTANIMENYPFKLEKIKDLVDILLK
jgi:hypothetical protein